MSRLVRRVFAVLAAPLLCAFPLEYDLRGQTGRERGGAPLVGPGLQAWSIQPAVWA